MLGNVFVNFITSVILGKIAMKMSHPMVDTPLSKSIP